VIYKIKYYHVCVRAQLLLREMQGAEVRLGHMCKNIKHATKPTRMYNYMLNITLCVQIKSYVQDLFQSGCNKTRLSLITRSPSTTWPTTTSFQTLRTIFGLAKASNKPTSLTSWLAV